MKKRWLAALLALLMVIGTVGMVAAEEVVTEDDLEEGEGQGPPAHIQKMLEMKAALGEEDDEDDEDDDEGPPAFVREMQERKFEIMSKSKLKINGNSFKSDLPPVIKYGRTLIPVGAVVKGLGAKSVDWNEATQTVTITTEEDEIIKLEIGKNVYTVAKDGSMEIFEMDSAAEILGNRTYVPLKYIALAMGAEAKWDDKTKSVNVVGHEKAAEAKMNKDKDEVEDDEEMEEEEEEDEE